MAFLPRLPLPLFALFAGLPPASAANDEAEPIKVFILAGQSNMEGKARVSLLEYQISQPETKPEFEHLQKDGKWVERDDVWIKFLNRKGQLTVGYGSPERIGPELEFGNAVGDHFDEPVLIIKTAWGGKSLFRDFRPPSAGEPPAELLQEQLLGQQKKRPETTLEEVRKSYGAYYRMMLEEIKDTLHTLGSLFPDYQGQGYEIAGFVWFQGWNDMINAQFTAAYADNMAHFIRDVRRDLGVPDLPFVIGQLGVGGLEEKPDQKKQAFKDAQAAPAALPEFKDNVRLVRTDALWDKQADTVFKKGWRENIEEWEKVGSDFPYHYLGSVRCMSRIGRAFGAAMLELQ